MKLRTTALAGTLAVLAVLPATAAAAEHSGSVNSATPTFEWGGGPGGGAFYVGGLPPAIPQDCNDLVNYCDTALVHVTEPGDLTLHAAPDAAQNPSLPQAGSTLQDLDVYVYVSDEAGTQGEEITNSETDSADETLFVPEAEPGYYLFLVNYALGGGYYQGDATWAPTPVEEEEPA